jgi:phosphoribosylformylglycinamidine synthase subunit PurS
MAPPSPLNPSPKNIFAALEFCDPPSRGGWLRRKTLKARVFVTLKNGVLDPQGKAIGNALHGLGFGAVGDVRQGKVIDLELHEKDEAKARASLKDMCEKLLANTVIEKYEIELKA